MSKRKKYTKRELEDLKKKPWLETGHEKPVTRRDFLSQGLIAGSSYILAPSILGGLLAPKNALACSGGSGRPANEFRSIVFDFGGGAPFGADILPVASPQGIGNFSYSALSNYIGIGHGSGNANISPTQLHSTGGVYFSGAVDGGVPRSQILPTLRGDDLADGDPEKLTAADLSKIFIGCANCDINDDSVRSINPLGIIAQGMNLSTPLGLIGTGSLSSGSGGKARFGGHTSSVVRIRNSGNVQEFTNLRGAAEGISQPARERLARRILEFNDTTTKRFNNMGAIDRLKTILGMAGQENICNASTPLSSDPSADAAWAAIWKGETGGSASTAIYQVLGQDNAFAATHEEGGHDGHNGTRANAEDRVVASMRRVRKAVKSALVKGVPTILFCITDGMMRGPLDEPGNANFRIWSSDGGSASIVFWIVVDPNNQVEKLRSYVGFSQSSGNTQGAVSAAGGNPVTENNLAWVMATQALALNGIDIRSVDGSSIINDVNAILTVTKKS